MVKAAVLPTLRHVGIVTSNLTASINIYLEFLGAELLHKYSVNQTEYIRKLVGLKDARIEAALLKLEDNNRVELIEFLSPKGDIRSPLLSNNIGASHFALSVESLDRLYERSSQFDVRFLSPPLTSPDESVKVAYVAIMEECIVELVEVLKESASFSGGE